MPSTAKQIHALRVYLPLPIIITTIVIHIYSGAAAASQKAAPCSARQRKDVEDFFMIKAVLCALGHLMPAQEVNKSRELFPVINTGPGGDTLTLGTRVGYFPAEQLQRCLSVCPLLHKPNHLWFNFSQRELT